MTHRIRAFMEGEIAVVRALLNHPMHNGRRRDESGELIPEHFIQEVTCKHNGNTVLTAEWSGSVSSNPFFTCRFKGGKVGDEITLHLLESDGNTQEVSTEIS